MLICGMRTTPTPAERCAIGGADGCWLGALLSTFGGLGDSSGLSELAAIPSTVLFMETRAGLFSEACPAGPY